MSVAVSSSTSPPEAAAAAAISRAVLELGCDRWPLHYACRTGNLEHVQCLIDVYHYPVNEPDAHDATPLYLAALTGHTAICQFLLERGATCDHSDAARIFYVALTPSLRRMLREWSLTAASRDPYLDSLKQHFVQSQLQQHDENDNDESSSSADCVCIVHMTDAANPSVKHERSIRLHSVMIRARCPWLAQRITEDTTSGYASTVLPFVLTLPSSCDGHGDVVYVLLEFLYTGRLELRDLDKTLLALNMAEMWELTSLHTKLKACIDQHILDSQKKGKSHKDPTNGTAATFTKRFRCEISDLVQLRRDMRAFAAIVSTPHCEIASLAELTELVTGSDVTLTCHDTTWSVHTFRLATQSDYFACALQGNFCEAKTSTLDLSAWTDDNDTTTTPDALRLIIQWLYADCFLESAASGVISWEVGVSVLQLGMALLIDARLASYIVNTILIPSVSVDTVFFLLELARVHGCFERLEEACCHVIAKSVLGAFPAHEDIVAMDENGDESSSLIADLLALLAAEAAQTLQSGEVEVADVPLAADIRRAIKRLNVNDETKEGKSAQLQDLVQQAVFGEGN